MTNVTIVINNVAAVAAHATICEKVKRRVKVFEVQLRTELFQAARAEAAPTLA